MDKKRKRSNAILVRLTDDEKTFLQQKMKEAGIKNREAYLRKMALDGYIIKEDFEAVKAATYELNKIGVNLNQMTKAANTYGDVYLSELKSIREGIEKIWQQLLLKV